MHRQACLPNSAEVFVTIEHSRNSTFTLQRRRDTFFALFFFSLSLFPSHIRRRIIMRRALGQNASENALSTAIRSTSRHCFGGSSQLCSVVRDRYSIFLQLDIVSPVRDLINVFKLGS